MTKKTADNDQQLELKKRARRRLVGAVVFVSVAAVVLPMVMDDEPMAPAGGIELHIPAQEQGYTPPTVGIAPTEKAAPSAAEAVVPATSQTAAPAPLPGVVQNEATSGPAAPKVEVVKPLPSPAVAPQAGKPAPVPATAAPGDDAKRAAAHSDGRGDKTKNAGPQYVVLIGAFSNQANVHGLQKKIGELGIRVYTEPLETPQGKKTRVRAGPFANREAAEKAASRLKKIGVSGVVAAKS
jgi:DedD protein